jgi:hypothetical protein
MWRGSARQREGVDLLRTTYESFTEGFEPRDLEEARAVLEELGDRTA